MSLTPAEQANLLRVGTVEYVSPDKIEVVLDMDAPDRVAANAGIPRPFPRINSYVVIPTEGGSVVCQVEWVTIERSNFPKRKGLRDYGIVDLPFPLRKMRANPLGVLTADDKPTFRRGVETFPTIGDPVLLPMDDQLRAVVESGEMHRVKIGTSPLAGSANVKVDPDRLFGRHLAVLGNTGSGKSCSVAGLIRWSLDAAGNTRKGRPNARFVVLDPNGEYERVFADKHFTHGCRVFRVGDESHSLQVPLWFWNSSEWRTFTRAQEGAQRPLLVQALRYWRNGTTVEDSTDVLETTVSYLNGAHSAITADSDAGAPYHEYKRPYYVFRERLEKLKETLTGFADKIEAPFDGQLRDLHDMVAELLAKAKEGEYPRLFLPADVAALLSTIGNTIRNLGGELSSTLPVSEDTPIRQPGELLLDLLKFFARGSQAAQYVEFLIARIRTLLADTRMKSIIGDEVDISLAEWLIEYIGGSEAENGCVTLVDLSLVPPEIIHLVTAVIARMTLEALQRYRKSKTEVLPTVLVMEEAHTFVRRYKEDEDTRSTASVCCRVFEKIAREGRKFGLGLVLSSQRPSELSQTVLSQCNTFLLHRISNDIDQERVSKLVPDNLRGLLRELPSLPSQHAILLGWASELPVLVRMNDVPEDQQPRSKDPDFWHVWTGFDDEKKIERPVNWQEIADEWQEKMPPALKEGGDEDGDAAVDGAKEC